jgi:hypothetical protein
MGKTLFILSDDFGELVLLRLLLYQQPNHVFLVLPERLYHHFNLPNCTKLLFEDGKQLKKYVEEIEPKEVMLFSAYLLAPNGLITFDEFYDFLDFLDQEKIKVSTSDPFMRFYDQMDFIEQPQDFHSCVRNKLKEISQRLTNYRHLYGVPISFKNIASQSFSNSIKKFDQKHLNHGQKHWTFVMAKQDFILLQNGNENNYHEVLIPLFKRLVQDDNININLIFPAEFLTILQPYLIDIPQINYINFCDLDVFEALISKSDLLIYWNVFSASTLLCRLYNKPIVFIAQGHMEAIYPGFFEYVKDSWFPKHYPEIIPIDEYFIPKVMEKLKYESNVELNALYQPYYELDSPAQVLLPLKPSEV